MNTNFDKKASLLESFLADYNETNTRLRSIIKNFADSLGLKLP
jgi:hypothetical protein